MTDTRRHAYHLDKALMIEASQETVFAFLDDHGRLVAHMDRPSPMMFGGRMKVSTDEGKGQMVGSHIFMGGTVLGIQLSLDEVITVREPPRRKFWQTVGEPRLLVIGAYQLGFEVEPAGARSALRVSIEYDLPTGGRWLGTLFGRMYAKWCLDQMLTDAKRHFEAAPEDRGPAGQRAPRNPL